MHNNTTQPFKRKIIGAANVKRKISSALFIQPKKILLASRCLKPGCNLLAFIVNRFQVVKERTFKYFANHKKPRSIIHWTPLSDTPSYILSTSCREICEKDFNQSFRALKEKNFPRPIHATAENGRRGNQSRNGW